MTGARRRRRFGFESLATRANENATAQGGTVSTITTPAQAARQELSGFAGRLIGPEDADYEEARRVYNAMADKRPALIARAAGADDVAAAIGFARDHGLLLAIRGGGHNGAGLGTCDDGVVVDLGALDEVEVDPGARSVRVGGGATWGQVDNATYEHGLATPSGIISTTGVGGLTLGGGLGHLTRRFGLAIDNLLAAELVLASGERVRASAAENHPDLFWAIRGGGGNFGAVTSFTFRLHEVGDVFGGPTFWAVEDAAEVLAAYREFLPGAPRELNGFFAFHTVPPAPPFPEQIHLRKVCGVVWCYAGGEAEASEAIAPLLDSVPEPLMHGVQTMPHPALQSAFDGLYPPGDQWYWRADFVNEIPDEAVAAHARFGAEMPTMKSTMHMYPIDGAANDPAPDDTAWSYRDATWASVFAGVDPDPANADQIRRWSIDYFDALHPYAAGGAYVNFLMDEGQERVQSSFRDNYARLAMIKSKYDRTNLFRVNQNIRPA
ncbi:MAG: FAD-binding protein, partial [Solirubrobacterales bacterium]|nr:FAD-binding protein [Solirubrobacterales bacterium]